MNFYAPSWDTCKAMECFFSYGGEFFLSQSTRRPLPLPLPRREGRNM